MTLGGSRVMRITACLISAALILPLRVFAQTEPDNTVGAAGSEPSSTGLQEVLVTAQRRSESGQSVPISIAAFDASQLQEQGATGTSDLSVLVPGVTLQRSGEDESIYIRGLGNSAGTAVPIFLDGVYQAFPVAN